MRAWEAATYACMGCAVERELCSPPLGGQTGYAARRSAGRRQAQRARARGNERGGGGSGMSGAAQVGGDTYLDTARPGAKVPISTM